MNDQNPAGEEYPNNTQHTTGVQQTVGAAVHAIDGGSDPVDGVDDDEQREYGAGVAQSPRPPKATFVVIHIHISRRVAEVQEVIVVHFRLLDQNVPTAFQYCSELSRKQQSQFKRESQSLELSCNYNPWWQLRTYKMNDDRKHRAHQPDELA
jgi:hypothetical protein